MQILVVSNRELPEVTLPIIRPAAARAIADHFMISSSHLYHDIETTGENPHLNHLLLEAWWNGDPNSPCFCIDAVSVRTEEVFNISLLKNKLVVAHNADFEARWAIKRNLHLQFYCTMVSERTIASGIKVFDYDIISCLKRRLIEVPEWMDKEVRKEFIGADPATFVIRDKHILYNISDVIKLPELKSLQDAAIEKLGLGFLIYRLRSPLVEILAQAEMTGWVHDSETWLNIMRTKQVKVAEIVRQLNAYLVEHNVDVLQINKKLAEELSRYENKIEKLRQRNAKLTLELMRLESANKTHLKVYEYTKLALEKVQVELAASRPNSIIEVNWSSPEQPIKVMMALGFELEELPKAKDQKSFSMKIGVGKMARANWFADHTTHRHMAFMKLFEKYKKIEHNIKSFGDKWIEQYINPVTGKAHTIFRQTGARTGRFTSGDVKKNYFNMQQIPGSLDENNVPEYRVCFGTTPGRSIGTYDYTGCEVVCMVSLAKDLDLKKITDLPDQHSYMGTKCWRAVYKSRYDQTEDPRDLELSMSYEMNTSTPEGTKARKNFKQSGIFPVIYGVKASKVAAIQGFSVSDGNVFIKTIEDEMPKVVGFVKEKAAFALRHGYVLHNTRTNSRRWFWPVLEAIRRGEDLPNKQAAKVETAARNSPVQGK